MPAIDTREVTTQNEDAFLCVMMKQNKEETHDYTLDEDVIIPGQIIQF